MNNNRLVLDFHMHPGPASVLIERRLHLNNDIEKPFRDLLDDMDKAGIDRAVTMLLDEEWFCSGAGESLMDLCQRKHWDERLIFCAMFDIFRVFELESSLDRVEEAARLGVRGIKIHHLLQRIHADELPMLDLLVSRAEKMNMFIVVHTFEESLEENRNPGLDIVSRIAGRTDAPVVIAHAGGLDFCRAVLLAEKYPNIMLDLSFIFLISNLIGLERLLKWGIDRIGPERFLFGSDHPSCPGMEYKETVLTTLKNIGLTPGECDQIMGLNGMRILGL